MTPTVVSFYTRHNDGDYYGRHAERLRAECDALGLKCWLKEVHFNGRPWIDLLREKSSVILEAIRYTGGPVLWVDVDCSVLQRPAFVERELKAWGSVDFMAVPKPPGHRRPFFMGCLLFNCTGSSIALALAWGEEHAKEDSEELAFKRAFNRCTSKLCWASLPPEYMVITAPGATPPTGTVILYRESDGQSRRDYFANASEGRSTVDKDES